MSQQFQVQRILKSRVSKSKGGHDYFVKWKDYPQSESTWEHETNLNNCSNLIRTYKLAHPQNPKHKVAPKLIRESQGTPANMKQEKAEIKRRVIHAKRSEEQTQDQDMQEVEQDGDSKILAIGMDEKEDIYFRVVEQGLIKIVNRSSLLHSDVKAMIDFYQNQYESQSSR